METKKQTQNGFHAEFKITVTKGGKGDQNPISWKMEGCLGCLENALAVAMNEQPELMDVMRNALGKAVMYKIQDSMQESQRQVLGKNGIQSHINTHLN